MADFSVKSRAQRFPIRMDLRYRPGSEEGWCEGTTANISRSGVLFKAQNLLEPGTRVEIILALPVEIGGEPAARVACQGRIIRMLPPESPQAAPFLAAEILDFRFVQNNV